ncbi:MAG: LysR substrate-binding domain-containing protein [Phreatobacter sp.]|uniref:LysR family transcriptional regulator n=1 Tax=Phreatobacter sp. TaxID=1966341 RepID=UPI0027360FA1|nr:LysR substrate-binding domain-containing protein [Phreatobacter sp.]MDP2802457.1 LysR substrate-binding domain-containing protein [Phreatobacter sp.]
MLDLAQVRSFVAVVACGSFHEAAKRLGLAQPTVSQHIRKLEEALGTGLVARSNAGCWALPKGLAFLPHAKRLLQAEEQARISVQPDRLVIGAASNIGIYLLPPAVKGFCEVYPTAKPVGWSIGPNPTVIERLQHGEVDIALTEWWTETDGFQAFCWRHEPLVVIVPPGHAWAGRSVVNPEELTDQPMIGGEAGTGTGRVLAQALGAELARRLKIGPVLGSTEAVKRAVMAGLGISIVLHATVAEEVAAGLLVALTVADAPMTKALWAATPSSLPIAAPARLFGAHLARNEAVTSLSS